MGETELGLQERAGLPKVEGHPQQRRNESRSDRDAEDGSENAESINMSRTKCSWWGEKDSCTREAGVKGQLLWKSDWKVPAVNTKNKNTFRGVGVKGALSSGRITGEATEATTGRGGLYRSRGHLWEENGASLWLQHRKKKHLAGGATTESDLQPLPSSEHRVGWRPGWALPGLGAPIED